MQNARMLREFDTASTVCVFALTALQYTVFGQEFGNSVV